MIQTLLMALLSITSFGAAIFLAIQEHDELSMLILNLLTSLVLLGLGWLFGYVALREQDR